MTIVTGDYYFATNNGGWERVDKFELEKTVPASEVTMLPDETEGDGA